MAAEDVPRAEVSQQLRAGKLSDKCTDVPASRTFSAVFTLQAVPISSRHLPTSVLVLLVQLTRTSSVYVPTDL